MTTDPRAYVRQILAMNPAYDPAGVLALRRSALKIRPAVHPSQWTWSPPQPEERSAMQHQLESLRREFWSLPLDRLKARLEQLDVRRFPELQPVVTRLRTVAAFRGEFPRLIAEPATDRNLFAAFKSAAVLTPGEAGPIKEQFLRQLNDREAYFKAVATARRIRDGHPLLYELEKDWFETILRRKKPRRNMPQVSVELPEFSLGPFMRPAFIFIVIIVVRIVLRML